MASLLSEEQFQCCICLDIFSKPVSIPCGHNFCLECIKGYWNTRDRPECPLCKKSFQRRPHLNINHALDDITEHFKRSMRVRPQQLVEGTDTVASAAGRHFSEPSHGPQEVICDICTGNKLRAVKSCLVCQTSYCETHVAPHQRETVLLQHRLTDPATFVSRGLCRKHNSPLEMFCRNDHTPLCVKCIQTDHKNHTTVSMERESMKMKAKLKKMEPELDLMTLDRVKKREEIRHSLDLSRKSVEREIESSVQVFSELVSAIEQSQAELIDLIQAKQREKEIKAEGFMEELEREIVELQRRTSELENISRSEDQLHFLQSVSSVNNTPSMKDWSKVSVQSPIWMGTVRSAVAKVVNLCKDVENKLSSVELNKIQQYAVDVTLDPVTAAPWLIVSPDRKQVSLGVHQRSTPVPDNPRRFDSCVCILGEQGFTTGRQYWVVQVGDKTDWDLGVAKESINRKGSITVQPDSGFWAICRRKEKGHSACAGPSVHLHLQENLRKVGVGLDYGGGMVSFYNAETKSHLYTFHGCAFTETLYPYFNPCLHDNGKNTAPLIICPVEVEGFRGDTRDLLPRPPPVPMPRRRSSVQSVQSVSNETQF